VSSPGDVLALVDARVRDRVHAEYLAQPRSGKALGPRVVLVGHRAAGKSTLLPAVAGLLGRKALDLDGEIERALGRPIRDVFKEDVRLFRSVEREVYQQLPKRTVVAAGGGFLALHADLLGEDTAVLVPVSFETYRERLMADASRPRLRPELSVEEELRAVYDEREAIHQRLGSRVMSLAELLASSIP